MQYFQVSLITFNENGQFTIIVMLEKSYIDGLVQDCSNSSALAMEFLQSSTKPLIYICKCIFILKTSYKFYLNPPYTRILDTTSFFPHVYAVTTKFPKEFLQVVAGCLYIIDRIIRGSKSMSYMLLIGWVISLCGGLHHTYIFIWINPVWPGEPYGGIDPSQHWFR